jgi:hypothetical protein
MVNIQKAIIERLMRRLPRRLRISRGFAADEQKLTQTLTMSDSRLMFIEAAALSQKSRRLILMSLPESVQ